jgi:hypothetical protein
VLRERLKNQQFRISLLVAIVLALFALVIAAIVVSTLALTSTTNALGPGYYPVLICSLMFLTCLYVIYSLLYGDSDAIVYKAVINRAAVSKPLALLLLTVVCVATMPLFGFLGSMFIFNYIELTYLEIEKQTLGWRLIYSAAISGGIFWLFKAMMIFLPRPFWL